jgi:hypothetical protein
MGTNQEPDASKHSGLTGPRFARGLRAVQNAQSMGALAIAPFPSTYRAVIVTTLSGGAAAASGGSDRTARTVGSLTIEMVWSRVGLHASARIAAAGPAPASARRHRRAATT